MTKAIGRTLWTYDVSFTVINPQKLKWASQGRESHKVTVDATSIAEAKRRVLRRYSKAIKLQVFNKRKAK